tara:strand:+ start:154 stop:921 length:768 start_codon:yes stop_codon:yes gene_type:complete
MMIRYLILLLCFFITGCDIDEDPPESPTNIRGYFTLTQNNPRIHISWKKPPLERTVDIEEYHIFRSIDLGGSFEKIGKVPGDSFGFEDTTVSWLDTFGYKVRAEDISTNIGSFSDSIFIECFKPGGNWELDGYDSLNFCIDPAIYSTPEMFQLSISETLASINDTAGSMAFPGIMLDTNLWMGTGWMYYTYSIVELDDDSTGFDTVTFANTIAPEYYTIDLSSPDSGAITFISGDYQTIKLSHSLTGCNGDSLFP